MPSRMDSKKSAGKVFCLTKNVGKNLDEKDLYNLDKVVKRETNKKGEKLKVK